MESDTAPAQPDNPHRLTPADTAGHDVLHISWPWDRSASFTSDGVIVPLIFAAFSVLIVLFDRDMRLFFAPVTLVSMYLLLARLVNSTRVTVTHSHLTTSHSPFPVPWIKGVRLPLEEVLYISSEPVYTGSSDGEMLAHHDVVYTDRRIRSKTTLIPYLSSEHTAMSLVQKLNAAIEPRREVVEHGQ